MPAIRTAGISGYFCEILRAGFFFLDYYKPLTAKTAGKSMAERRHQFSGGRYRSFPLTALHIQAQLHQHTLFIMKMRNRYIHQLHIGIKFFLYLFFLHSFQNPSFSLLCA